MPNISNIENREIGASVRSKLNQAIGEANKVGGKVTSGQVGEEPVSTATGEQTLSEALDNRVIYVNSISELNTLPADNVASGALAKVKGSTFIFSDSGWHLVGRMDVSSYGYPVTEENIQAALSEGFKRLFCSSPEIILSSSIVIDESGIDIDFTDSTIISAIQDLTAFTVNGNDNKIKCKINGNSKIRVGALFSGEGNEFYDSDVYDLYSVSGGTRGVDVRAQGCYVEGNRFNNLSAQSDGQTGSTNGATRAVYYQPNGATNLATVIKDNRINGIFGDDGDGIQIQTSRNSGELYENANCIVTGNTLRRCQRRAIKVQASDVVIKGNFCNQELDEFDGLPMINVINARDVIVEDNFVISPSGVRIGISGTDVRSEDIIVTGNHIGAAVSSSALFFSGADRLVAENNTIRATKTGVTVGFQNTSLSSFSGNTIYGKMQDGESSQCVNTLGSVDKTIFVGNRFVGITNSRAFQNSSPNCLFMGNTFCIDDEVDIEPIGSFSTAIGTGFVNNVALYNGPLYGGSLGITYQSGNISLPNEGPAPLVLHEAANPNTRNLYYQRGTVAFNRGSTADTVTGWFCTESGTPGVWVEFSL